MEAYSDFMKCLHETLGAEAYRTFQDSGSETRAMKDRFGFKTFPNMMDRFGFIKEIKYRTTRTSTITLYTFNGESYWFDRRASSSSSVLIFAVYYQVFDYQQRDQFGFFKIKYPYDPDKVYRFTKTKVSKAVFSS